MDSRQTLKLKRATGNQYNCVQNLCASPPEEPFKVALWQYATTILAVILGRLSVRFIDRLWTLRVVTTAMAATCIMLVVMHRRHRLQRYEEIRDYCDEQIRYVSGYLVRPMVRSCVTKQAAAVSFWSANEYNS